MASAPYTLLAIDTATPCSSVAITSGTMNRGTVLGSLTLGGKVTHSRRLLPSVEWLMEMVEIDWSSIDGICVSLGPGSFTGLRIGMSIAKGLAAGAGKPLVAVSTLDALAAKCTTERLICAVLDARKKEVYCAFYRNNEAGFAQRLGDMAVLSPEALAASINEPVIMVGEGGVEYQDLFKRLLGSKLSFAPSVLHEPNACSLGLLGAEKLHKGETLDIATGVPIYIRSSDAELNLLKQKQKQQQKIVNHSG